MWKSFLAALDAFLEELVYGDKNTITLDYMTPSTPPQPSPQPPPPTTEAQPSPSPMTKIQAWANAIKTGEGANPTLNNPGNLKYSTLTASWGASRGKQASDGGWLSQFPTYQQGFTALCNFLTLACEGELIISHPQPCSLQNFTVRYAGNPPQGYIDRIAATLDVPTSVDISTFLVKDSLT